MNRARGARSKQKHGSAEVKRETKRNEIDTKGRLIKEVHFDYAQGHYEQDLIDELRRYLIEYNPLKSEANLVKIVFGLTDADEANRLETYINRYSVYLVGIGIKGVHFEFGKYPNDKPTELKEPKESEKKRKKKKSSEIYGKPKTDEKEKRVAGPVKERQLPGSHLLGFDEGYGGSGMTCPSSVNFGRNRLINAIETICAAGYHMPITRQVCFSWRAHLTVITVLVCEGARFYPMSLYFSGLIERELEEPLLEWLVVIINSWDLMSEIHRGVTEPIPYSQVIPDGYNNLTPEMVEELRKDKHWVDKVLAIPCRAKK